MCPVESRVSGHTAVIHDQLIGFADIEIQVIVVSHETRLYLSPLYSSIKKVSVSSDCWYRSVIMIASRLLLESLDNKNTHQEVVQTEIRVRFLQMPLTLDAHIRLQSVFCVPCSTTHTTKHQIQIASERHVTELDSVMFWRGRRRIYISRALESGVIGVSSDTYVVTTAIHAKFWSLTSNSANIGIMHVNIVTTGWHSGAVILDKVF